MQPGWNITSEWLECPACHHIIPHSLELDKTNTPCPECGIPGARILYPSYPEADLIHMAAYFFEQGEKRRIANQTERLEEALFKLGKQYDPEYLEELATELNQRFSGSTDPLTDAQMLQDSLNYLMTSLDISFDQATCVWHPLMGSTTETFEEHKAAILMACSAFESLFLSLLIHLGIWHGGLDPRIAEQTVENIRSPQKTFDQFKRWAGCSFSDAADRIGFTEFKQKWEEIRLIRNDFMHGKDDVLTRSAAVKTIKMLPQLVAFFAALNNHFIQ